MVPIELGGIKYSLQDTGPENGWVLRGLGNLSDLSFVAPTRTEVLGAWADFIYRPANGPKDFASDVLAEY
jgi:hypothetical protein